MNTTLRRYWNLLSTYLDPQRPQVALLAVLIVTHLGFELLSPQIVRYFIDSAVTGATLELLLGAAVAFIGVGILNQLFLILASYMAEKVSWVATNALRADLAAHCLKLDLSFHKARTPGELIERVDGDVTALANFFSQFLIYVVSNVLLLFGILGLLFWEDWRVGLGLSIFAFITLALLIQLRRRGIPHWGRSREASANFFGFLSEYFGGTEDVRANGATSFVMQRFYKFLKEWLGIQRDAVMWGFYLMRSTSITIFAIGSAIALGMGAWLYLGGLATIGTVYLIFRYTELLRRPIEQLRNQIEDLQRAEASISRVEEILNTKSKLVEGVGTPLPDGPLSVAFEQLSFGYEGDDELVLHHLDFKVAAGKVVGLLGRTGSGKTTTARLLLRLYDPTSGEIRLGGVPLRDVNLHSLRQHVGLVTQDVQLFHATVRDNLTFFDKGIADAKIVAVLEELGLSRWYQSLAAGLDTKLEGNSGLSAGEAQLLAFARVFLKDPGLVILDEASSRLDPLTEELIERAISKLLQNRTAFIIAHRLDTVQRADEIIILEKGRVVEHGDRLVLESDPTSRFATLLKAGLQEVLA